MSSHQPVLAVVFDSSYLLHPSHRESGVQLVESIERIPVYMQVDTREWSFWEKLSDGLLHNDARSKKDWEFPLSAELRVQPVIAEEVVAEIEQAKESDAEAYRRAMKDVVNLSASGATRVAATPKQVDNGDCRVTSAERHDHLIEYARRNLEGEEAWDSAILVSEDGEALLSLLAPQGQEEGRLHIYTGGRERELFSFIERRLILLKIQRERYDEKWYHTHSGGKFAPDWPSDLQKGWPK